jgi:cytochrome c-type biogenesis protein CcmH
VVASLLLAGAALGAAPNPDPALAERAARLASELRCLVCQNQSIADSNAELAVDLRRQIDEQIREGRSDTQIRDYMVERYGDFVLYRPPMKASTFALWVGPAVLLVLGFWVLRRVLRRSVATAEDAPLSAADRERAARLLAGNARNDIR